MNSEITFEEIRKNAKELYREMGNLFSNRIPREKTDEYDTLYQVLKVFLK